MRPVARLGDMTIGTCRVHGNGIIGIIIGGSLTSFTNGRPTARIGDSVFCRCGHTAKIVTGTIEHQHSNIKIVTARLGDIVQSISYTGVIGPYTGVIITASLDTLTAG